jgi:hypothetical protein
MSNEELYQAAEKAVDELHSDTSVSVETAIENLSTLRDHIRTLIDALKCDISHTT